MFFEVGIVKDKKKKNQDKTGEERLNPGRGHARRRGRARNVFPIKFYRRKIAGNAWPNKLPTHTCTHTPSAGALEWRTGVRAEKYSARIAAAVVRAGFAQCE